MLEARIKTAETGEELFDFVGLELLPTEDYGVGFGNPEATDGPEMTENEAQGMPPVTAEVNEENAIKLNLKDYSHNLTSEEAAINRLREHDLLTHDEVIELAKRIEKGDLEAKDRLIDSNRKLAVNIARGYRGIASSVTFSDLCQFGFLGLIRAAEKFDYRKGFKFSTYATPWVRQSIARGIQNTGRTIRVPVHIDQQMQRVRLVGDKILTTTGKEPSAEELSAVTGVSVETILDVRSITTVNSLDHPLTDEGDEPIIDMVPDKRPSVEEEVISTMQADRLKVVIREAIKMLPDSPINPIRQATAAKYGIEGYSDLAELKQGSEMGPVKIEALARKGEIMLKGILLSQKFDPKEFKT